MAALPGGVTDVKGHENSLQIDDLARFAVDDHNKKEVLSLLCFNVVMIFHFRFFFFNKRVLMKLRSEYDFK